MGTTDSISKGGNESPTITMQQGSGLVVGGVEGNNNVVSVVSSITECPECHTSHAVTQMPSGQIYCLNCKSYSGWFLVSWKDQT